MNKYELTLVLDSDLTSESQKKALIKIKKMITDFKGKVVKVDEWGTKALAYPIKKKTSAVFQLLKIDLEPSSVKELDQKLRLEDNLLRFLIVKID